MVVAVDFDALPGAYAIKNPEITVKAPPAVVNLFPTDGFLVDPVTSNELWETSELILACRILGVTSENLTLDGLAQK